MEIFKDSKVGDRAYSLLDGTGFVYAVDVDNNVLMFMSDLGYFRFYDLEGHLKTMLPNMHICDTASLNKVLYIKKPRIK